MRSPISNTAYTTTKDLVNCEVRRPSSNVQSFPLTANVAILVNVATLGGANAEWTLFNACNLTGTAVIPYFVTDASVGTAALPSGSANNVAGTAAEYMPTMYNTHNTTQLSIISPQAGILMLSFYSGMENGALS